MKTQRFINDTYLVTDYNGITVHHSNMLVYEQDEDGNVIYAHPHHRAISMNIVRAYSNGSKLNN